MQELCLELLVQVTTASVCQSVIQSFLTFLICPASFHPVGDNHANVENVQMRAPSDADGRIRAVSVRAVNGEKRRGKERERGIDSVSAPIGHHSLTPLSLPSLPYGRDRHLWRTERGGGLPRPVCYFKIVIRPPHHR